MNFVPVQCGKQFGHLRSELLMLLMLLMNLVRYSVLSQNGSHFYSQLKKQQHIFDSISGELAYLKV